MANNSSNCFVDDWYVFCSYRSQDLIDIANSFSEPIHLIGHSFGGLVSQYAASKSPQSFASVTLLCSGPGPLPKQNWGGLPALVQAVEKGRSLAFIWFVKTVTLTILRKQKFSKPVRKWRKERWLNTNPLSLQVLSGNSLAGECPAPIISMKVAFKA